MTKLLALVLVTIGLAAACSSSEGASTDLAVNATTTPVEPAPVEGRTLTEPEVGAANPDGTADEVAQLLSGAEVVAATDFADWAGQRIGLIAHQNSVVGRTHLADLLHESASVELVALFGPEHGIRGTVGAGDPVDDDVDPTGVPIHSLYGANRAPSAEQLAGIDMLVYDLQDVGTRYFTYVSTMGLAMQAAAEADISFVVLDRPNPLGRLVSGLVRDPDVDSFIAQYPVPDVYGLTAAEFALAMQAERWLPGLESLDLRVVPMANHTPEHRWPDHATRWIPPSPSLTTPNAALVYPATVLFEATSLSIGRGTEEPFTVFGAPELDTSELVSMLQAHDLPGVEFSETRFVAPTEPYAGELVQAVRIHVVDHTRIQPADLGVHLLDAVLQVAGTSVLDRPEFLDLLSGGPRLRNQLAAGVAPDAIVRDRQAEARAFAARTSVHHLYE